MSHIATFFTHFSKVLILHFFPHKLVYLMAILIFIVFLFESVFVVIRKCWTGWLQLGLRWRRQVQPAPIVLVHFQGWANLVTTADRVNTHGYHNHVCSGGELWLHIQCQIYANMQLRHISAA